MSWELDPVLHAPKRLRIASALSALDVVEASYLRDRLGLTAPDLSKQMRILVDAGYVAPRNTGRGPGSRTWYRLTRDGRQAFDAYRETLRGLLEHTAVESFEVEGEPEPRLEPELELGREPELELGREPELELGREPEPEPR